MLWVYRLIPTALSCHDWDLSLNQGEVLVQARSSGEARAIAASAEARSFGGHTQFARRY